MFIKNIIISGFRSYREQSFPDGLSPKTNVVVGKNGSGKSNFFAAVQFVLNEKFANLRAAERKELFHVGSGRPSLSIFVEIVFDNSDGRVVIPGRAEEPEVRIRRTIGLKQDEFRVNDRKFSASDVHQLLESAGFSSSNPYYIVEQGKIVNLVNMSEEDRYHVIKDVAGTKVYEARRAESESILADTEGKQTHIGESIKQLEERLSDLEKETLELKQFQEADQEKKKIEYCIFHSELENARSGLAKLEEEWNNLALSLNNSRDSDAAVEQEIRTHTQRMNEINTTLNRLDAERKAVEGELSKVSNQQTVMELDVGDASGRRSHNERERVSLVKEDEGLVKALRQHAEQLARKRQTLKQREQEASTKAAEAETQLQALEKMQEKRNRTKLFKNKAERDAWITQELARNAEILANAQKNLVEMQKSADDVEKQIEKEMMQASKPSGSEGEVEKTLAAHEQKMNATYATRDRLNKERRQLWQKIHEQENVVQRLEEASQHARQQVERVVRHDIRQGIQSLQEVLYELNNPAISSAVHGPLIELIAVEEGFETAVEVTAGNALFNIVVDSFDVSAILLEEMNRRRKPGRISFFPLDTCRSYPRAIPSTSECSSLLSKISFDDRFKGVVAEVFGRTAVVTLIEAGARLVKELQCDVVTLDGDQLGRKGGITGGYIDKRSAKLAAYLKQKDFKRRMVSEREKLDSLCQEVASTEQSITEVLNELESLRNQNASTEKNADSAFREDRLREERLLRFRSQLDSALAAKKALEKSIAGTELQISRLREESQEAFKATWSVEEEEALEKRSAAAAAVKEELSSVQTQALQIGTEVKLLEDTMQHLERRRALVADRMRELGWSKNVNHNLHREHASIKAEHASLQAQLVAVEKSTEAMTQEKQKLEATVENLRSRRLGAAMGLQEKKDKVDQAQAQRNLLTQRRDDALQKLRRLGVAPKDVQTLSTYSLGKLMHLLRQVNEQLKRYSHVNRKALDQHAALLETKNDLCSQQDTLKKELETIYELINHLDHQKEEAIERTYKQIQFQFEEVFKELAGTDDSSAELQLIKSNSAEAHEDPFVAVRIRVSFGLGAAVSELEQLSGGQKSLVALALIFAIQRCDPAPFYLFDEIDAALDSEYRTAVAKMIERQSAECQFIIATFKSEMVSVADRVLGVFFHNKVSRIQTISPEEGVRLLKQAALEDRKRSREGEE